MPDTSAAARELREHIAGLFDAFVEGGEGRLAEFLQEVEDDIAALWTVPAERQERYLRRLEHQVRGIIEVQRLELIGTTKAGVARAITLAFKLAVRLVSAL